MNDIGKPGRSDRKIPTGASLKAAVEAAEALPPHVNQFLEIEIVASLVPMRDWFEDIPFLEAGHFITPELGEILTAVRSAQAEGRKVTAAWVARQLGVGRFLGAPGAAPTLQEAFKRLLDFPTGVVRANLIREAQELVALTALRQNVAAWTEPPATDAAPAVDLARRTRETGERWLKAESCSLREPTPSPWRRPQDIPPRNCAEGMDLAYRVALERAAGAEYVARNPRRADRHPGSFSINTRTGRWADFAMGDSGDAISLVAYLCGIRPAETARELAATLGVDPYD